MRILLLTAVCGLLAAQSTIRPPDPWATPKATPAPPATPAPQATPTPPSSPGHGADFSTTIHEVVSPVIVLDRHGDYVNNIQPYEFHLYDDDREQNISVYTSFAPISLVLLVQANSHADPILPQVNKIGGLIGPQVIGDNGETALIAYDSRIRLLQDFTTDRDKITQGVKKIQAGSESNRMVDAVWEGMRMLQARPVGRRRIILLIGETRDMGSEIRAREVMINLQLSNITLYAVDMSRFITTVMAPAKAGRPDPLPPAAYPLPSGVAATPTAVQQMYGTNSRAEFLPLMQEIFLDAKAIFKVNPVELFTKATGGSQFGFHSQRTLEEALTMIGERLHSEYTVSYTPNNTVKSGFHAIRVDIDGHPDVDKVITRLGYYLGAQQAQ
jgi:VWFA-related protein